MRRVLIPLVVAVVGLLAGALVSGMPTTIANDISIDDVRVPASTTPPSVSGSLANP